jgi:hypothetical protein
VAESFSFTRALTGKASAPQRQEDTEESTEFFWNLTNTYRVKRKRVGLINERLV